MNRIDLKDRLKPGRTARAANVDSIDHAIKRRHFPQRCPPAGQPLKSHHPRVGIAQSQSDCVIAFRRAQDDDQPRPGATSLFNDVGQFAFVSAQQLWQVGAANRVVHIMHSGKRPEPYPLLSAPAHQLSQIANRPQARRNSAPETRRLSLDMEINSILS